MNDKTVSIEKASITKSDIIRNAIIAVAAKATEEDRKFVADIIARAKRGKFESDVMTFSPIVSALLFLEHNPLNRDWRADGTRSCSEYARRMRAGLWRPNNASIGFYKDGQIEDGQHRLSGAAFGDYTLQTVIVFGIDRDAISTVDDGATRHGSDHAKLNGIANSKTKQTIVKSTAAYLVKTGDKGAVLKSEKEVGMTIEAFNELLDEAIDIGKWSSENVVKPVLKLTVVQSISFLLLRSGWPKLRVREKLALFQTGQSMDGESTPYFTAAQVIFDSDIKRGAAEKLSETKKMGIVVLAMTKAEQGVKAIGKSSFKAAVKKDLPDPSYPQAEEAHKAA